MATPPPSKQEPPKDGNAGPEPGQDGQALYLRLMTEQLTGWNDPRSMLERALKDNLFLLYAQKILPLKPDRGCPI